METLVQSEGFHQYLILRTGYMDTDSYEMNMLMRYEGKKLLPLELQCKSGEINVSYEISGATTLQLMFQGKEMESEFLQKLFCSLWECYEELEEYLLPIEGMLLQPELIYYQPGKNRILFCYLPGYREEFQQSFLSLVEFCMKRTRHQDSEAVLFIYGLYRLLQEGSMEREELKHYLTDPMAGICPAETSDRPEVSKENLDLQEEQLQESLIGEMENCEIQGVKPESKWKGIREQSLESNISRIKNSGIVRYLYGGLALITFMVTMVFGIRFLVLTHQDTDIKICIITTILTILFFYSMVCSKRVKTETAISQQQPLVQEVLSEEERLSEQFSSSKVSPAGSIGLGETSVLEMPICLNSVIWELESLNNTIANISLNHFPGILGRKLNEVDYVVPEEGVSRRHMLIFQSGEDLYVEDLSSTNGTYINGIRLKPGEPGKLCDGDRLSIGPNLYQVKCNKGLT